MPSWTIVTILILGHGAAGIAPASESTAAVPTSPLANRLAERLSSRPFHPSQTGVSVLLIPEGRRIFEKNALRPLRPASTMKILTSAAALSLLRPEFVYETGVYADGEIDSSGTIRGNLYVRGRGAPDLVGEAWWLIVRRLSALGLRQVEGDLVADESYFDSERRPAGWPPPSEDSWYNAPVGALSCNFNVVRVRVEPSAIQGARPHLALEPIASYFQVQNRATSDSRPTSITVERIFETGRNTLIVDGRIRRNGGSVVVHRAVEEPALYSLYALREIARAEGIRVDGGLRIGAVPENAVRIHRHRSRALASLVRDAMKNSNNFMAEALLKTIGAERVEVPGTTMNGLSELETYLRDLGLDTAHSRLADGSGLSNQNRLTARLITDLLARVHADFEIGPELVASLPIGGADGTLDERFGGEGRHRVRAKTGRVATAIALAGYVANRDGRRFAFTILANRPRGSTQSVQGAIDHVVEAIATSTNADLEPQ